MILPDRTLRRATDENLEQHYRKVSREDTPKARAAELQIMAELERRDLRDERRREREREREERHTTRRNAIAANRAARNQEREANYEQIKLAAEAATQGYLVNPKGRARGISDEELLTGPEAVFDRYATPEAREYFATHHRPTKAHINRGVDTRFVERVREPRRKRPPLRQRATGWSR